MTPDEIIVAFEKASGLIVDLMRAQRGDAHKPLVVEAKVRLEQSTMLLKDFRQAELTFSVLKSGPRGWQDAGARVRLYGEAFYYFAWRARQALETCGVRFDPKGVKQVRNHMIEHPDGSKGIPVLCWVMDCPQGLLLEPKATDMPGADPGLYPNAQEYIEKLLPRLEAVVSAPRCRRCGGTGWVCELHPTLPLAHLHPNGRTCKGGGVMCDEPGCHSPSVS